MIKDKKKRLEYASLYRLLHKKEIASYWRKYYYRNRDKELLDGKEYYRSHKNRILEKSRKNYLNSKEIVCKRSIAWRKNNPFKAKLSALLNGIRARCRRKKHIAYKYYGKRGIKCELEFKDILYLWQRDNANSLKRPSIDRIDNDGPYSIPNCRFIELSANIRKRNQERKSLALSRRVDVQEGQVCP
jgi:hypothetical protein